MQHCGYLRCIAFSASLESIIWGPDSYPVGTGGPTAAALHSCGRTSPALCCPATGWGSGTAGAPVSTRAQGGHPAIPRDFSPAGRSPWGQSDGCHPPSRATSVLLWPHLRLSLSLQPCKQAAALLSLELPKDHRDVLSQVRQAGAGGPHICPEPLRTLYFYFTGAARRQPAAPRGGHLRKSRPAHGARVTAQGQTAERTTRRGGGAELREPDPGSRLSRM